jgi:hypothetical protein
MVAIDDRRSHRSVRGAAAGDGEPKPNCQTDRADHHQDDPDRADVDPGEGPRDGELALSTLI